MIDQESGSPQNTASKPARRKGTIMLVSGDLDKALTTFEIAAGFQAMGMEMNIWFVFYGVNCLLKPRSVFSPKKWFARFGGGFGRNQETDMVLQHMVRGLNHQGHNHLPMSQLNFAGMGPMILGHIMRRKGVSELKSLIYSARDLGVNFKICQVCIDVMAISVPDDLIVDATIGGVTTYYLDVASSQYNVVI